MAGAHLLGLIPILLLHLCKSQDLVTSKSPLIIEVNAPTAVVALEEPKFTELPVTTPRSVEGVTEDAVEGGGAVEDPVVEATVETGHEAGAEEEKGVGEKYGEEFSEKVGADLGVEAGDGDDGKAGEDNDGEPGEEVVSEPEKEVGVQKEPSKEVGEEAGDEVGEVVAVDNRGLETIHENEEKEQDLTPGPAETYVPVLSTGPGAASPLDESNAMGGEIGKESNHFNEIITSEDELLNLGLAEAMPTLGNLVDKVLATPSLLLLDEESGNHSEVVEDTTGTSEGVALGLEAWKIGAISAAVFLIIETIFISVYCLKCKKNTIRRMVSAKACEDSEATDTVNEGPAEENILSSEDGQTHHSGSSESDTSQSKREETMMNIPLDSHDGTLCPQDASHDTRISFL